MSLCIAPLCKRQRVILRNIPEVNDLHVRVLSHVVSDDRHRGQAAPWKDVALDVVDGLPGAIVALVGNSDGLYDHLPVLLQ